MARCIDIVLCLGLMGDGTHGAIKIDEPPMALHLDRFGAIAASNSCSIPQQSLIIKMMGGGASDGTSCTYRRSI